MPLTSAIIDSLTHLLTTGEVRYARLSELPMVLELGLWTTSEDQKRAVATPTLVRLIRALPSQPEVIAAILSCEPSIRQSWQHIVCARLQELGHQRDTAGLCQAIATLGQGATSLQDQMPQAKLASTPYTELERSVFEVPAEQAIAAPKLYRVLGAIAPFIEREQAATAIPLPNVSPLDPSQNWLKGRLLQPPDVNVENKSIKKQWKTTSILSGDWSNYIQPEADDRPELAAMYWVLARPWCFLLAQVVFTQEAWAAERISGEFSLELDVNHQTLAYCPPKLSVVVTSVDGDEILCGSLAELLLRVCHQLGVEVFSAHVDRLDEQLANVIEALIQRKVWQYSPGAGGHHPHYTIHPNFSDTCYRALGSKYFNRLASAVTAAIRSSCEQWAKERTLTARLNSSVEAKVAITS